MTQKVIDVILNNPQCMASVRAVPCEDYMARFGAFIRIKHGIITLNLVDWHTVATTVESHK